MDSHVAEIKSRLNIVELVGSYVKLQKAGAHWKAPCPFHQEKTPSFMVNEDKQIFHCFGCHKGGDVFSFVMEIENVDFKEALKMLADRTGVELPRYRGAREDGARDRSLEVLELACKFFEKQLWEGAGKKAALTYLSERGLSDGSIRAFRLGFALPGWRHLLTFLRDKGFAEPEIVRAGLMIEKDGGGEGYDRFRDRIMFPIMDQMGRVVGFTGRVMPGADDSPAGGQAKYINTPETGVYHKSRALYGIQLAKQAIKQRDHVLLVEGNMDVIACYQAGLENTVAVSGTALTAEQLALLKRYTKHIRLFFDMDGAGQTAAWRSAELALMAGMNPSVVAIEGGKDAADLARHEPEKLREAVGRPTPALAYFLSQLLVRYGVTTAEGRQEVITRYGELVAAVADPVERSFAVKRLAEAIRADERTVADSLKGILAARGRTAGKNAAPPVEPTAPRPALLTRRSEFVRERLVRLALLEPAVWRTLPVLPEESLRFLRLDTFGELLVAQAEACGYAFSRLLDLTEDETLRERLAAEYFAAERFAEHEGLGAVSGEERGQALAKLGQAAAQELVTELRRERMLSIENAMREARSRGDKEGEKRLLGELQALLAG